MTGSTWRAAALLLVAFVLGGLAGAAVTASAERSRHPSREHQQRGERRGSYMEMLAHELDLTAVQRDSVRVILDRYRPAMDSLWRETRPRFETLQERIRSDIRSQLTPEQITAYNDMLRRFDADRHNRESR
jgi:Spy/CpxP family protein refolding chaperone